MPQPIKVPLGALKLVPLDELTAVEESSAPLRDPSYHDQMTVADRAAMQLSGGDPANREHPHMGPVTAQDNAPVTLGDLIENPTLAVRRMVHLTKAAVTDPKVMIPAAIGLGIGALGRAADVSPSMPKMPSMAGARNAVGRGLETASESVNPDLVSVLSPRAGAAMKAAGRLGKALQTKTEPAPAEAPPASGATPPATPAPTAATPAPATASANASAFPSLDELKLTPAEISTAVKWHEQGVSPEHILHRILQSRQLTARTGTTTPDQAATAVRYRNEHGRWQDEH